MIKTKDLASQNLRLRQLLIKNKDLRMTKNGGATIEDDALTTYTMETNARGNTPLKFLDRIKRYQNINPVFITDPDGSTSPVILSRPQSQQSLFDSKPLPQPSDRRNTLLSVFPT
jgi:hypothetical protein